VLTCNSSGFCLWVDRCSLLIDDSFFGDSGCGTLIFSCRAGSFGVETCIWTRLWLRVLGPFLV